MLNALRQAASTVAASFNSHNWVQAAGAILHKPS
jgi:hypothetical protein